jgi:uncharacterized membrane protein YbjE (DUF340 family)
MDFLIILISFGLGIGLSNVKKLKFINKYNFLMYTTAILLFIMGYQIGNNNELFKKLPSIGVISFELAVFAMLFSLLFSFFMYFLKRRK